MNFFVYGTLKIGGYFATDFDHVRTSSVPATLNNMCLYNLGWFPTIKEGDGKVIGEVHTYEDEVSVLAIFDNIEGYSERSDSGLYLRREVDVVTEAGEIVKAMAYILNSALPSEAKKIKSGVWVLDGVKG